jgi:hypothetical protein
VQLTYENSDLVPEHHGLDVLIRLASSDRCDEAEDPAWAEIGERDGHGRSCQESVANVQLRGPIDIVAPFTSGEASGHCLRP